MDYEKAYKAVLQTAKQWIKDGCTDKEKICLECVFPELRESEDEMIRNWLLVQLETNYKGNYWAKKAVAYLEKQEQKPAEWEDYKDKVNIPYCSSEPGWSEMCIANVFEAVGLAKIVREQGNDKLTNAVQSAMIELSKMEKPAWGEEDSRKIGTLSSIIFDYAFYKDALDENNDLTGEYAELDNWLESLPERFNLQPKPDWSEEDEKMIDTIVSVLGQYIDYKAVSGTGSGYAKPRYSKEIDWLKSLRPQPKAELTLLDENIIKAAIAFVEQNDHFNYWGGIDKRTVLKALRSLRPFWKPSEEQMNALNFAITYFIHDTSYKNPTELRELYEQLKKLQQ